MEPGNQFSECNDTDKGMVLAQWYPEEINGSVLDTLLWSVFDDRLATGYKRKSYRIWGEMAPRFLAMC